MYKIIKLYSLVPRVIGVVLLFREAVTALQNRQGLRAKCLQPIPKIKHRFLKYKTNLIKIPDTE